MAPRRFLFLFSDTGGGHRAGAEAVAQAMVRLYGDAAQVTLVDALVASEKWPFHRFPAWYPTMLRARAMPWKAGFWLTDHRLVVDGLTRLIWPYVRSSLHRLLDEYPAQVVVSFHALLNRLLGLGLPSGVASATVVLDFLTAHALWYGRGLDCYALPYGEMVAQARRWGVPEDRVQVLGMPVRQAILDVRAWSPAQARSRLGMPLDRPVVLVVGGGEGMGPQVSVVQALVARRPEAHLVVITGRNARVRQALQAMHPKPYRVLGYTQEMAWWLRAADVLVTKAGPNTLAEAFVLGLPLVLYTAIPGQEEGNVTLVRSHGAGVWAPRPAQAAHAVMHLLRHPQERAIMAQRAAALATPDAAASIARCLWALGQR